MATLNTMLIPFVTFCFAMGTGIFFILYCLEQPIYSAVGGKETDLANSDALMRRVLVVLQQFLSFKVPIVMVTLVTCGTLGSGLRLALNGLTPLPILVALSSTFAIVYSGFLVPSAIKMFESVSLEASTDEIQTALAPIVRLHHDVGILIGFTLILQLTSVAF